MTRRFFAQLFIGITLALPIRFEHKSPEATSTPMVECGPVSPLRKGYPAWDHNAFTQTMMVEVWKRSFSHYNIFNLFELWGHLNSDP